MHSCSVKSSIGEKQREGGRQKEENSEERRENRASVAVTFARRKTIDLAHVAHLLRATSSLFDVAHYHRRSGCTFAQMCRLSRAGVSRCLYDDPFIGRIDRTVVARYAVPVRTWRNGVYRSLQVSKFPGRGIKSPPRPRGETRKLISPATVFALVRQCAPLSFLPLYPPFSLSLFPFYCLISLNISATLKRSSQPLLLPSAPTTCLTAVSPQAIYTRWP